MSKRYCTVPSILWLRTLYSPFEDLCKQHDKEYVERKIPRLESDRKFRDAIRARGYPKRAWLAYVAVRVIGWFYWRQL